MYKNQKEIDRVMEEMGTKWAMIQKIESLRQVKLF